MSASYSGLGGGGRLPLPNIVDGLFSSITPHVAAAAIPPSARSTKISSGVPIGVILSNYRSTRRSDFYPKAQIHKWLSKKCRSLSKRCKSNNRSALYYSSNGRPTCAERKAAMKRCALCHGRLGLGARFRNLWNGRWWVHVRFCSVRCEGIYEVRRNEAAKHRWYTFLAGGNSLSKLIGPTALTDR